MPIKSCIKLIDERTVRQRKLYSIYATKGKNLHLNSSPQCIVLSNISLQKLKKEIILLYKEVRFFCLQLTTTTKPIVFFIKWKLYLGSVMDLYLVLNLSLGMVLGYLYTLLYLFEYISPRCQGRSRYSLFIIRKNLYVKGVRQ